MPRVSSSMSVSSMLMRAGLLIAGMPSLPGPPDSIWLRSINDLDVSVSNLGKVRGGSSWSEIVGSVFSGFLGIGFGLIFSNSFFMTSLFSNFWRNSFHLSGVLSRMNVWIERSTPDAIASPVRMMSIPNTFWIVSVY